MRTFRRPLSFAAACLPVLLGVVVVGAQPAAAAASDCGTTSTRPDGQLDADRLQDCLLEQVQASINPNRADEAVAAAVAESEWVASEAPVLNALDVVFTPEQPVEEAAPAYDGLGGTFAALRDCESGGDYGINTGNGYYGAYQFALATWQGLGYGGYPHEASPATQDQAASELQALYGWGQWPGCSWYLGL